MALIAIEIQDLFRQTFGSNPVVPKEQEPGVESLYAPDANAFKITGADGNLSQLLGNQIKTDYLGREVWLPVWFREVPLPQGGDVFLPWSIVKISGRKTIVKTPLMERKGTVKELYNIDDYAITIKGFLIDLQNRVWPEAEIKQLKQLFELQQAVKLDNALTNLFLDKEDRVVIESLEMPEVEGGRNHVRPFVLELESDSVFTLELEDDV